MEGKLYNYHPTGTLVIFAHSTPPTTSTPHALILIGGLGDGLTNLPYTQSLAQALPLVGFRLISIQLSSSNLNYGITSIAQDVLELSIAVTYIRKHLLSDSADGKVVLMGSSTGSQDVLTYVSSAVADTPQTPFPAIDGAILQAPVSDRDAFRYMAFENVDAETEATNRNAYDQCLVVCKREQQQSATRNSPGKEQPETILPLALTNQLGFFGTKVTCSRFLSLWSPGSPAAPSPDDMFSADLSSETLDSTFGAAGRHLNPSRSVGKPEMLILHSGADEYHPPHISQTELLERWKEALEKGGARLAAQSGVVEGSRHNGAGDTESEVKGKTEIVSRVVGYLAGLIEGT